MAESVATVPAVTRSPSILRDRARLAGEHRLVDSALPSTTWPSAGMRAPGRTENDVALLELGDGDGLDPTVSVTRSASSGSSSASAARALLAWPIAFISCQWPSSMIAISAASSHQKSRSKAPNSVASAGYEGDRDREPDQAASSRAAGRGPRATAPVRKGHPP